eukprot:TRINITY_DN13827_c0_g1_i2.p1 TRINITY_DN13827_c0_g1~~TRINITY_DN13827_c0_g1_i2.p1  ORF type:complete len:517 (+),score=164.67 TRINITY_DN13827_c0_g1_i2:69-1553(+)
MPRAALPPPAAAALPPAPRAAALALVALAAPGAGAKVLGGAAALSAARPVHTLGSLVVDTGQPCSVVVSLLSRSPAAYFAPGLHRALSIAAFAEAVPSGAAGCAALTAPALWSAPIPPLPSPELSFAAELPPSGATRRLEFALVDCTLGASGPPPPELQYEFAVLSNGGHFGADEAGLLAAHSLLAAALLLGGPLIALRMARHIRATRAVHLATLLSFAAYVLQQLAVLCETAHLWVYSLDGRPTPQAAGCPHMPAALCPLVSLEAAAACALAGAELLAAVVLLALAEGWSLATAPQRGACEGDCVLQLGAPAEPSAAPCCQRLRVRRPLAVLTSPPLAALLYCALLLPLLAPLLGEGDAGPALVSSWQGLPGVARCAVRCALAALFLSSTAATARRGLLEPGALRFLSRARGAGAALLLADPLLTAARPLLPAARRRALHACATLGLRAVSTVGLLALFCSARGPYAAVSSLGSLYQNGRAAQGGRVLKVALD